MTDVSRTSDQTILVTGGSGFVSLHCIALALHQGYRVRTTVRSEAKKANVLKGVKSSPLNVQSEGRLDFVVADLLKDEGWMQAVQGVHVVLHVASPFPATQPKDENELIRPAVEGTLRVLRAAKAAGVRRTVVTSSVAAIAYGVDVSAQGKDFTEEHWSDVGSPTITAYAKSKTLAERAAWDYIGKEGAGMELSVVNPVAIFGPPLLLPNESTTCDIIKQMLEGKLPAVPNVSLGLVDVRDVASLTMLAAFKPEANGQRYISVAGDSVSLLNIASVLRKELGPEGSKAPRRAVPDFLVRTLAYVVPMLRSVAPELGKVKRFSNAKARALGWEPKSNEEAIVSCARALVEAGVVGKK